MPSLRVRKYIMNTFNKKTLKYLDQDNLTYVNRLCQYRFHYVIITYVFHKIERHENTRTVVHLKNTNTMCFLTLKRIFLYFFLFILQQTRKTEFYKVLNFTMMKIELLNFKVSYIICILR